MPCDNCTSGSCTLVSGDAPNYPFTGCTKKPQTLTSILGWSCAFIYFTYASLARASLHLPHSIGFGVASNGLGYNAN